MNDIVSSLIAAAWMGIAAILAWSLFQAARRVRNQDADVPFFRVLGRRGVTLTQAEEAVGIAELSHAVRRCVLCRDNEACRADSSHAGHAEADCPNASMLKRVR